MLIGLMVDNGVVDDAVGDGDDAAMATTTVTMVVMVVMEMCLFNVLNNLFGIENILKVR